MKETWRRRGCNYDNEEGEECFEEQEEGEECFDEEKERRRVL